MINDIKRLNPTKTYTEIAETLGIPYWKVAKLAKKEGLKPIASSGVRERVAKVLALKSSGLNYIEIANNMGVNRGTVSNIYKKNGFILDGPGSGARQNRKIIENPFKDLSKPEVMYWIGFLAADGNLSSSSFSIRFSQSSERAYVLEEYVRFLNGNDITIFINKGVGGIKDTHLVTFGNEEIYKFLESIGFSNRKSKTLDLKIPLTWDFVRGYFDGDGSAKYYKKSYSYKIKITCTNTLMIDRLVEFLNENDIPTSITYKDKRFPDQRDINILSAGRRTLFEKMYVDNCFCVKEKRGVIEQSINENSVNCLGIPEEGNQQPSATGM